MPPGCPLLELSPFFDLVVLFCWVIGSSLARSTFCSIHWSTCAAFGSNGGLCIEHCLGLWERRPNDRHSTQNSESTKERLFFYVLFFVSGTWTPRFVKCGYSHQQIFPVTMFDWEPSWQIRHLKWMEEW